MEKELRRLLIIVSLLGSVACSTTATKAKYNYDRTVDFTKMRTYAWLTLYDTTNDLGPGIVNDAVERQLQAKGLKLSLDNPDLMIVAHVIIKEEQVVYARQEIREDQRGYYGPGPDEVWDVKGIVILEFLDGKTRKPLWRGFVQGRLEPDLPPEKEQELFDEGVENLLKNFPPSFL